VRKCLSRNNTQCSFIDHRNYKVIYRRYASLYFIVGVDPEEEVSLEEINNKKAKEKSINKLGIEILSSIFACSR